MRKGYTLVELLVTILLLCVIGGVVTFNVVNISKRNKKNEYKRYIESILSASKVYSNVNSVAFAELYDNKAFIYIKLDDLVKEGLLDEDLKNPYTKEKIDKQDLVKANLDESGALTFIYPLKDEEKEVFLVTQDDYVVNGESFECLTGIGTYELTLANEDGTYVDMTPENIAKYNFTCEFSDELIASSFETPGTYDITYRWITESGTKKKKIRKLTVLPPAVPDLEVKDTNGNYYTYNKLDSSGEQTIIYQKPTSSDCTSFNRLMILPTINGNPSSSANFIINKRHSETDAWESVTYDGNYIPVDDGITEYEVSTTVTGHHSTSYSYNTSKIIKIEQDILINKCGVNIPDNNIYDIAKTYTINTNSISTNNNSTNYVEYYEWKLVPASQESISNNLSVVDNHKSNQITSSTVTLNLDYSSTGNTCTKVINNFDKLYVRAITNHGYISSWNEVVDSNLLITNDLYKLVNVRDCSNASSNINNLTGTLKNIKCFYNNKRLYAKYGDNIYTILGLRNDDGVIAILNSNYVDNVTLTELKDDVWEETSVAGTIKTPYKYSSPKISVLYDNLVGFTNTLPDNHDEILYNVTWDYKIGAFTHNVPSISDNINTWLDYKQSLKQDEYNESYAGILTSPEAKIFGNAIKSNRPFFLGTTYSTQHTISNYLGDTTEIDDVKFLTDNDGEVYKNEISEESGIKPVIIFRKANICNGNGTIDNPYEITISKS